MAEPDPHDPELLISVDADSTVNAATGLCCVFDPTSKAPDSQVPELAQAEPLVLPPIDPDAPWTLHGLIDAYGDMFGEEDLAKLLFVVSKKGGGLGFTIEKKDFFVHAYEVDKAKKIIFIDEDEVFSTRTNREAADTLREAIFREFEGGKTFWDHAFRVAKGAGITVLGAGEIFVGVVGIIVPEPATTAAGVVVTVFGASQVVEGVTQMFNLNEGEGLNPLEEGFAAVGDWADADDGEQLARMAFAVTNLVVSVGGSYKLLKIPGSKFLLRGTVNTTGKVYREGATIGRLQLLYELPQANGRVLVNVLNNNKQWIFRLQQVSGQIVLNGRIVGVEKFHRVENAKEMLKVLVKLALHGAKKGL
jgi:hypothetical protein